MAIVDDIFKDNLLQILSQDWEIDNRSKWNDGTPVMTKRVFGVVNRYDLSKEFPIQTLRKQNIESCFKEISWIYQQRSTYVDDLGLNIWNNWTDDKGSIGRGYGYQVGKDVFGSATQIHYVLNEIKENPTSRRLIVEMWNVDDLDEMNLVPCAHHIQFNIKNGKLNAILKQRSGDFVTANNFNVVEYSLLLHMVARHTGYKVGELIHVIGDMHIYNKHEEQAYDLLNRTPKPAPKLIIDETVNNFFDFKAEHFKLENYEYNKPQLEIEVAI
ncbi:thymidylate synthase [Oceanobacillus sp. FSL H7-0719]|uniref:thymidylate synthase n=1 Tax=Oceanobacillus sp. FSL H7-0719 TaxID=2954507 RepID=UPI003253D3E2